MIFDVVKTGTPVLLLHGFLEQGNMWHNLIQDIDGCRLIVPDLPGHGRSADVHNEMTMGAMADALFQLMDELQIASAHVVGHSMGGYIAMEMIKKAPERVSSMLFFQSTATADPPAVIEKRIRSISAVQENKALYIRTVIKGLFAEETKNQFEDEIEQLVQEAMHLNADTIARNISGMKDRLDSTALMRQFKNPKGYFLGAHDPVLANDRMQKELHVVEPDSYYMHPTMGHMAHIEAPESARVFLKLWLELTVQS